MLFKRQSRFGALSAYRFDQSVTDDEPEPPTSALSKMAHRFGDESGSIETDATGSLGIIADEIDDRNSLLCQSRFQSHR